VKAAEVLTRALTGPTPELEAHSRARESMIRAMTVLFLAGGGLALIVPFLPRSDSQTELAYFAIGGAALLFAAISRFLGRYLMTSAFEAMLALGTFLVTLSIYFAPQTVGASENELMYLWPILYSGYFFSRRAMVVQFAFLAVCYAVLLFALDSGEAGAARWVWTIATLTAAAVFVRYLRERLDRDLSLQQATIESTTDGILVVDRNGNWESFNRRFVDMWRIPSDVARTRDDDAAIAFVLDQLTEPGAFVAKIRDLYEHPDAESYDELQFKDGRVFERYSKPARIDGRSAGRVWSFRDVTERKRFEERLQHLADHDPLTDLYNRRRFEDELARELMRSARYKSGGALLLLDLDDFKAVNDEHGHVWGDEVLRASGRLLRSRLRSTDVLARIGGDEFAVLLPEADEVRATKLAEELLEVFRSHSVKVEDDEVRVTASVGVLLLDAINGADPEPMVAVDTAMYRAKHEGRDRLALYAKSLENAKPVASPRRDG
jgi:diguanylate cyclase (GGDEF)-like protein